MDKDESIDYFVRPNILWHLTIIPAMLYTSMLAYLPDLIPFEMLGILGKFSLYLYQNHKIIPIIIFWCAWTTHFLEAIYVVKTAKSLNINQKCRNSWFFQTLFVGYPSTRLINIYYNSRQRKNN